MNFRRASIPLRLNRVNVHITVALRMRTKYSPTPGVPLAEVGKSSFQTIHPEHEEAQWGKKQILG